MSPSEITGKTCRRCQETGSRRPVSLWRQLWDANLSDGRAIAGVDMALHDVRGKTLNQSVADMYGGRVRDKVLADAAAMNYVASKHHLTSKEAIASSRRAGRRQLTGLSETSNAAGASRWQVVASAIACTSVFANRANHSVRQLLSA